MTTITIDRAVLEQVMADLGNWSRQDIGYATLLEALNAPQPEPMSVDQISMIFNRVYPAQPLSQNIINLVQEVEKHHRIR